MSTERRFRFAPTPSRELHVGNALAALFGWSMARAARGRFVLRVEDIDRARCKPAYEDAIYRDLAWLGLDWDEGPDVGGPHEPYRQSERLASYDDLMRRLGDAQLAYACVCSRADIRSAQSAPHTMLGTGAGHHVIAAASEDPVADEARSAADDSRELPYPGTCRGEDHLLPPDRGGLRLDLAALTAIAGIAPVVEWHDGLLGPQSEDVRTTSGDVLLGRPGQPTYQIAVVADDRAMGITDVVRGVDLTGSTARQILLHKALAHLAQVAAARPSRHTRPPPPVALPRFHHHPLLVDEAGRKLSKRDASLSLSTYAVLSSPAALRAQLGRAIGLFAEPVRRATRDDWIDAVASRMASTAAAADAPSPLHDAPWSSDPGT